MNISYYRQKMQIILRLKGSAFSFHGATIYASAVYSMVLYPSVCLSPVRPSITSQCSTETAKRIIMQPTPQVISQFTRYSSVLHTEMLDNVLLLQRFVLEVERRFCQHITTCNTWLEWRW